MQPLAGATEDDVCVLIVNWNSSGDTLRAISALRKLHPSLRVFVVDNNSAEQEKAQLIAGNTGERLILSPTNDGYGAGMNLGFEAAITAGCSFAWLINPDASPTPGALDALLRASDGAVAISPRQVTETEFVETYNSAARIVGERVSPVRCEGCTAGIHEVDVISGTGLFLRLDAVVSAGMFDTSFFHYKEEFDLVRRMACRGSIRLACTSLVVHRRGGSLNKSSPRARYYSTRNELLYVRKANKAGLKRTLRMARWTIRDGAILLKELTWKNEPMRHIRMYGKALIDGWRGRGGALP